MSFEAQILSQKMANLKAGLLNSANAPWIHQSMTRQQAESLLSRFGMRDGLFLLRPKEPDSYALSMAVLGQPVHHLIERVGEFYTVNGKPMGMCTSLNDLVQFLRQPRDDWPYPLLTPLTINAVSNANNPNGSSYELLWEAQTDDLYIMQPNPEAKAPSNTGPTPSSLPRTLSVNKKPMVVAGSPPTSYDSASSADITDPDSLRVRNASIALNARPGSVKKPPVQLDPAITGTSELTIGNYAEPEVFAPPRPQYDEPPPLPSSLPPPLRGQQPGNYSEPHADQDVVPPLPPKIETKASEGGTIERKRSSSMKNFLSMVTGKKKDEVTVQTGLVTFKVMLYGSSAIDNASGEDAAEDGIDKVRFVSHPVTNPPQKAVIGFSIKGFSIQARDSKEVLHQYPIENVKFGYIDRRDVSYFCVITSRPNKGKVNNSCFVMQSDSGQCYPLLDTLRQALEGAGYQVKVDAMFVEVELPPQPSVPPPLPPSAPGPRTADRNGDIPPEPIGMPPPVMRTMSFHK